MGNWIQFSLLAGVTLGFYDYWTKRAMTKNSVFSVVFWSSAFGALAWLPFFIPWGATQSSLVPIQTSVWVQSVIMVKGAAMTLSWLFAYFSVREIPMSYAGAVRASGPLWTLMGGIFFFGEYLTGLQLSAVLVSIIAFYMLSRIGSEEGISALRSLPLAMMLIATMLSALTTVYDKYIIANLGIESIVIQTWSAMHRFLLAGLLLLMMRFIGRGPQVFRWSIWVPLTGLSWVGAEWIYFLAVSDPDANVTYISVFRRTSLVVGFVLSVALIGEKNVTKKALVICLLAVSTATLIVTH